ncbi:hypothetical protein, partial [Bilophila wadsworthia]
KGGKTFLEKSFSLPSPNPIPPFPKTFDFIESLLSVFPMDIKSAGSLVDHLGCPAVFLVDMKKA